MNYLYKQVSNTIEMTEALDYLVNFFIANANRKVEISELTNETFSFEEVDREISKLVSRNLINEYYVSDKHVFEYATQNEIVNSEFYDEILLSLKEQGYRITDSRKKLIKIFTTNPNNHYTFDELVKLSGKKVNIATMYNNLATLLDERIIGEFHIDDTKLFELNNKSHAHFICSKCKLVFNVDTKSSSSLDADVEEKYNFKVSTKRIEFTGECNNCKAQTEVNNINVVNEHGYQLIDHEVIIDYFGFLQAKTNKNTKGITLVFLSQSEIHNLNNEFREIDRPTDVLSFVENSTDYLGDILICYDYIQKQADEYGHSFKRELLFLITHGYLHLIGYDHIEPEDEKEMFEIQNELLNKYGVSRDE